MREIRKILYVRTDRMGDVLMNLPAIRVLRQAYPKAWITLAVDSSVAPLFQPNPDVDEVYHLDTRQFSKSSAYRNTLRKNLKKIKFDAVIISNADKHLHWLAFRAGIPIRLGWDRKWGFLMTHRLPDDKYGASRHEIDSNIKLVSLLTDKAWDGRLSLFVQPESLNRVDRWLEARVQKFSSFVVLHTGTSRPEKRWRADYFKELALRIISKLKKGVIFIGDEQERALVQEIVSSLDESAALSLVGMTSLQDLTALFSLSKVSAVVSCDSGPLHIAWIMGRPVVGLYAANVVGSDPKRWGPKYVPSREIYNSMDAISVDEVEMALKEVVGFRQ